MLWDWHQWETWTIPDIKTTKCVPSVESIRHFGIFVMLVTNINSLPWDRWYCSLGWRTYPENVSVPRLKTQNMMMSSNGKIFGVIGRLYGESIRGIHESPVESPHKDQWRGALCFLWFAPEQTVEQTMETPVRRHRAHYYVTFSTVVYWTHWEGNSISIKIHGAQVWNSLPQYVKSATSINDFKNKLRNFLTDKDIHIAVTQYQCWHRGIMHSW